MLADAGRAFTEGMGEAAFGGGRQSIDTAEPKSEPDPDLGKIAVLSTRFYRDKSRFMSHAGIDLSVRNSAARAIRRLHFHGKLQSSGRALPWVEDDFTYEISGGLEPGETQSWSLTPNMMSEFYRADEHDGAKFIVTVTDVDWAD